MTILCAWQVTNTIHRYCMLTTNDLRPSSYACPLSHPCVMQDAAAATEPLRDALWGDHKLAVLLPPGTRIPPAPGFVPQPGDEVLLTQDGEEARSATSHELAGSSPFSGV